MVFVTSILRVGGSVAMIVPPAVIKEMDLVCREKLIIKYNKREMNITKLNDMLEKEDKGDKGEKVE